MDTKHIRYSATLLVLLALGLWQDATARDRNVTSQPVTDTVAKTSTVVHDSTQSKALEVMNTLRSWKSDPALVKFITGLGYKIQGRSAKSFDSVLVRYLNSDEYDPEFVAEFGVRITVISIFLFQLSEPFRARLELDPTIVEPDSANIIERRALTMVGWPALERVCNENGIDFPPPLPPLLHSKLSKVLPLDPNTPENDLKQGLKKIQ